MKLTVGKITNLLLILLILLLVFVPDTKTWFMRQMISAGFYNARPDKVPAATLPRLEQLGLVLRDSNGETIPVDSLKGKVVFLNFWATWCPPCRAEMPSLNKLYTEFKDESDIRFLFISEDEEPAAAADYFRRNKFILPLYSADGQAPGAFYAGTLPTTLVFDKAGALVYKHEGMANYNTSSFISRLKALQ